MTGLMKHFETLTDPRVERRKLHQLHDIIFITIAAVICGCDEWNDIEEFGTIRYEWLKTILELPNGIPSHDTFNRVFSLLDPQQLQQCFSSWVQSVAQLTAGSIISIDGKRMCNSGQGGSKALIHMVSAWSSANEMVLAQQKVDDKSNEITAIPALLDILDLKGCLVTIDAMGCQHDIAKKIISKGANYILAVKNNQEHLYDDLQEAFEQDKNISSDVQVNTDHGRIEKRKCSIITDMDWICKVQNWTSLHTLIKIESERSIKNTDIKAAVQTRYYISSHQEGDAAFFNHAVREHWGIENKLHWTLDVAFGEDKSTKQAGNAAENFSFINKIALNLLKQYDDQRGAQKMSIKTKRKKCGWDKDYLLKVLKTPNQV